jgi:transcriptional regulator with XRE-family HTH domain
VKDDEQNLAKLEFGRRVYRAMAERGWRQAELARAAGLPRDHISRYIAGKSLPTDQNLTILAEALDKRPEDLLPKRAYARLATTRHAAAPFQKMFAPFAMHVDHSDPGLAWISVSRAVTIKTALEVAKLLHSDNTPAQAD